MRLRVNLAISVAISVAILAGGVLVATRPLPALPEYTEKEKKECVFCHPNDDYFALNAAGMYYAEHRSFEEYEAPGEKPAPAKPKPAPEKPKPAKPAPAKPEPEHATQIRR